jgi:pyrimidine-nucleoside phosphorylase
VDPDDIRVQQLMGFAAAAPPPVAAVDVLRRKRDGGELADHEIAAFVEAAARGTWPDYQLAALLMAVCVRGMTAAETAALTRRMADSGKRLDLSDIPGPKVDKHSTGGVGDKTSLILAPLAAACGVVVPMMSGRGLGHTGGTLDKLEAIPGFRVNLSETEFRAALKAVGIGMIGQTADVAPADKKLYALRDVTGTVESIPLITGSILSKKLAEGIDALVLDVKVGRGAFMKTADDARALARSLVDGATANGLRCEALLTDMNAPLGRAVGNTLEVIEAIDTLKCKGPKDLTDLSVRLAARMVRLAGRADTDDAALDMVNGALRSGAGVERFRRMVEQQGGDPHVVDNYGRLPTAPRSLKVTAQKSGFVKAIDAEAVGVAAMRLGAGRRTAEDRIDPAVGVIVRAKPGDPVTAGDTVFEVHYTDQAAPGPVVPQLQAAFAVSDRRPPASPLVLELLS